MPNHPKIAVVMPAYNAQETIEKALSSLDANDEPHDIFVVDDCSPVPVEDVISKRPNLNLIRLDKNQGVIHATNVAIEQILQQGYQYIALLDSDDYSSPDRLKRQREFLDNNPDVVLVGGWANVISETGKSLYYLSFPTDHDEIMKASFYNFAFLNSSLMFRVDTLKQAGSYSSEYPCAQDYEFSRRMAQYGKLANIPDYLVDYTVWEQGESIRRRREQVKTRIKIQWAYKDLGSYHFYLGIMKALAVWYLPLGLIARLKRVLPRYKKQKD